MHIMNYFRHQLIWNEHIHTTEMVATLYIFSGFTESPYRLISYVLLFPEYKSILPSGQIAKYIKRFA